MIRLIVLLLLVVIVFLPFAWPSQKITGQMLLPIIEKHRNWPGNIVRETVLFAEKKPQLILHAQFVSLEPDRLPSIIACDHNRQLLVKFDKVNDKWDEQAIAHGIPSAAHINVGDIDDDGDSDLAVAVLGNLYPDENKVGSVLLMLQEGDQWVQHKLPFPFRRIADVEMVDIDADGDQDLLVAEFGHVHGSIQWLECTGDLNYKAHILHRAPGAIHIISNDFDADGDVDFAACVSQHDEEVYVFENLTGNSFKKHRIFKSINYDLGISGMTGSDIDEDGDLDLILSCGDNFENSFHYPQPYHGCYLLSNAGGLNFKNNKIADIPGCYGSCVGDFDGDGDKDVAAVSVINSWSHKDAYSLFILRQSELGDFETYRAVNDPIQMVTCDSVDLNGDGRDEILTGCMHLYAPFERLGGVDVWYLDQ